jgi:hypothetical protein
MTFPAVRLPWIATAAKAASRRCAQHEVLLRRHGILQQRHARKDHVSAVHRFAARTAHGMTPADGEAIKRIRYQPAMAVKIL